jgi:hypothetical protein
MPDEAMAIDENAAAPEPRRRLITLRREYQEAIDTMLGRLERELRIFDPDLQDLGLNAPERVEILKAFLKRSRNNRLYIAVHRPDRIVRQARLMSLLGTFSASMFIHRTEGDAARVQDCFVLCDDLHVVRRAVAAQPRGVIYLDDPKEASGMRERFDQIWESSQLAVSASQAGLT